MEDSGVFAAIAENRGGKAKCSANLVVEERRRPGRGGVIPPSFVSTVQDVTVKAGSLARFDAKITGTKPLDVHWLKNGSKVVPDIRYKTVEEDNLHTLLILEATPQDSGRYECVAINSAGEARCDAECLVQPVGKAPAPAQPGKQAPADQSGKPRVVKPLTDQTVREGQPVEFSCKITGPSPDQMLDHHNWYKGNKIIKPSRYFQMNFNSSGTYTLKISEAFPEDEGEYKCEVKTPAGAVSTSAKLRVQAPETQEVAPKLTPMKDVIVPEGSPAQFKTQVTGKPQPTVQWYREGALIPQSADFQMIHEGNYAVLLISTTYEEDSGKFTCRATNAAGQTETSAKLLVKSKD